MIDINLICQDLYDGNNYQGMWHGSEIWGKASDFHEHPFFIWETIQKIFTNQPLNILETGRASGQSATLFGGIAEYTKGSFISFDLSNRLDDYIKEIYAKYRISSSQFITDSSLNADKYLDPNKKFQVIFLDSLHSYEQIKQETLLFEKYLDKTSIIFFHDTIWCFDAVMGWLKDYLQDKNVVYAKHKNTHKPQCQYCETFNKPGLLHGRPSIQINGRPNFQSPYDLLELSPYFNNLSYDFIKWSDKSFEQAIQENHPYVFTNIDANCGIGCLVIKK
jgi:hypothetical protein